jgi:hypothetical protein
MNYVSGARSRSSIKTNECCVDAAGDERPGIRIRSPTEAMDGDGRRVAMDGQQDADGGQDD